MPGRELNDFRRECRLLRAHLDEIAGAVDLAGRPGQTRETLRQAISQRLANIEAAIRRAKKLHGGVTIE